MASTEHTEKLLELDVGKGNSVLFEGLVRIAFENNDIFLSTRPTSPSADNIRVFLAYIPESTLTSDRKKLINRYTLWSCHRVRSSSKF